MQSGLGVQALTGSVVSRRLAARRPPGPRPSVTPRRYLLPLLPAGALWLALLASGASRADAGIVSAPGENLEISLITYGPGAIYWERFGHNSIEIRDEASGEAVSFNYGVFDFDERGFLLNFARGRMHYMINAELADDEQRSYIEEGRSVIRQRLSLSAAQAAELRDFLLWNLRPENVRYDYDYLIDNCSTRVRDALDGVLDGQLRRQLTGRPGSMTYRQQIARLMSPQPWLMLLMDLGLGPFADQPLNAWQESFLPVVLHDELRSVRIGDGHGGSRLLVAAEQRVAPDRLPAPRLRSPDLALPLAVAGVVIAVLLVAARRRARLTAAVLGSLYVIFAGVVGVFLLGLWMLTLHHAAWKNANLLVFHPLAFALLRPVWRGLGGAPASRVALGLLRLQLAAAAIAVLLHCFSPGFPQQNQPWLLFSIPIWSALAWNLGVGQRTPADPSAGKPARFDES